jgi:hypothetical protein
MVEFGLEVRVASAPLGDGDAVNADGVSDGLVGRTRDEEVDRVLLLGRQAM